MDGRCSKYIPYQKWFVSFQKKFPHEISRPFLMGTENGSSQLPARWSGLDHSKGHLHVHRDTSSGEGEEFDQGWQRKMGSLMKLGTLLGANRINRNNGKKTQTRPVI